MNQDLTIYDLIDLVIKVTGLGLIFAIYFN